MDDTLSKNNSARENLRKLIVPFIRKVLQDKPSNFEEYGADYFKNLSDLSRTDENKNSGSSELKEKRNKKEGKKKSKLQGSVSLDTLIHEEGKEVDIRETSSWGHSNEKKAQKQRHHIAYNRADFTAEIGDQKGRMTGDASTSAGGLTTEAENEKLKTEKMSQGDGSKGLFISDTYDSNDSDSNQVAACSEIENYLSELVDRTSALYISAEESTTSSRRRWEKEAMKPSFKMKKSDFPEVESSSEESCSDNENYGYSPLFNEAVKVVRNAKESCSIKNSTPRNEYHHSNLTVIYPYQPALIRINELVNCFSQTFHDLIFKLRATELDFNQKLQKELMIFFQSSDKASNEKLIPHNTLLYESPLYGNRKKLKQDMDKGAFSDHYIPVQNRPRYTIKRQFTGTKKIMDQESLFVKNSKPQFVDFKNDNVNFVSSSLNSTRSNKSHNGEGRNKRVKSGPPEENGGLNVLCEASRNRNNKINSDALKEFSFDKEKLGYYKENTILSNDKQPKIHENGNKKFTPNYKTKTDSNEDGCSFKFGRKKNDNSKGQTRATRPTSAIVYHPFSNSPDELTIPTTYSLQIGEQGDVLSDLRTESSTHREFSCQTSLQEVDAEPSSTNSNIATSEPFKRRNTFECNLLSRDQTNGHKSSDNFNASKNMVDAKQFFDGLMNRNSSTSTKSKRLPIGSKSIDSNTKNAACSRNLEKTHRHSKANEERIDFNATSLSHSGLNKKEHNINDLHGKNKEDESCANGHIHRDSQKELIKEGENRIFDINNDRQNKEEDLQYTLDPESVSMGYAGFQNGVAGNRSQNKKSASEISVSEGGDRFMKQEIISQTLQKQSIEPGLTSAGGDFVVSQNGDGNARDQRPQQNILDDSLLSSSGISIALVESAVKEALKDQSKADDDMEFDYFSENDSSEYCSSELSDESYSKENLINDEP